MGVPTIHIDAWPILVVTYQPEMSLGDIEAYAEAMRSIFSKSKSAPFVLVADIRRVDPTAASPIARRRLAEVSAALNAAFPNLRGEVVVCDSTVIRGLLTAHSWLKKSPLPLVPCKGMPDAFIIAKRILSDGAE